jgi:UrcA family protein
MSLRVTLAVAALALTSPVAVFANPANQTDFEADVPHSDLDLATPDGAARLDERVRTKIRQLCANGGRDGVSLRLERECRETALAATAPAIRVAIANARLDRVRLAAQAPSSPAATSGA